MITLRDILNTVEIQSEVKYFCYDYEHDERIELTVQEAEDCEVKYMYCEDDTICIEVEREF